MSEIYSNPQSPHVFHVLLALERQERHGYAIIREVERVTEGRLCLSTGTLYSALKRMLANSWIRETGADPDDERRRVYGLTPQGRKVLAAEKARLEVMLQAARSVGTMKRAR